MEFSGRNAPPPSSEEIHLGFKVNEEQEVTKGLEEQEMVSVFVPEITDTTKKGRRQNILMKYSDIFPKILSTRYPPIYA